MTKNVYGTEVVNMKSIKFKEVKILIKECNKCGFEVSGSTSKQLNQRLKLHQTSKYCIKSKNGRA